MNDKPRYSFYAITMFLIAQVASRLVSMAFRTRYPSNF